MNEAIKHLCIKLGIGEDRPWETIDYFEFWLAVAAILMILGMIAWGIFYLFNSMGAYWYEFSGRLEAKQYEPSTSSTSIGMVSTGNGAGPMVASSSTPESFDIWVRLPDKSIQKLYVDQQRYFDLKSGDTVIFWKKKGRLNGAWIDETTQQPNKIATP
jgi:hypothetical protein